MEGLGYFHFHIIIILRVYTLIWFVSRAPLTYGITRVTMVLLPNHSSTTACVAYLDS